MLRFDGPFSDQILTSYVDYTTPSLRVCIRTGILASQFRQDALLRSRNREVGMPRVVPRLLGLMPVLAVVLPTIAVAQVPAFELSGPACPDCSVAFEKLVRLGEVRGPGMFLTTSSRVRVDSRGRFFASDDVSTEIRVFSPAGEFITALGREGEGPGEFLRITAMGVGQGDSIFAFDRRNGRVTVFGPGLTLARTFPTPFPASFDNAFVAQGWIVNANISTPDRAGFPLHLISWDGALTASFGSRSGALRPDVIHSTRRAVGPATSRSVWAGWLNQYALERWSVDGDLELVLTRSPTWFEPYWELPPHNVETPPPPVFGAVRQVGNQLWVLIRVADPEFQDAIDDVSDDGRYFSASNPNDYFDTIIEVIDLETREVVATRRVDPRLFGFAGPGLVYGPELDTDNNPYVSIWRVSPVLPDQRRDSR